MFELSSKNQDEITITTKQTAVKFNVAESEIDANLAVGKIKGPGEFEIGDVAIRGIAVDGERTIYDASVGQVHIAILGGIEAGFDELGMIDILCTESTKAVKEINPKLIVAMGNVDGMVTELKLTARTEKKLKIKKPDDFPTTQEVVVLN
ncbi:hypothetical protein IJ096_01390 [Candidatus Saccharibacteria bacterium]|nr:hypothetical protein [Candidatus Saccharibacteria bacterium]